MAHALNDLINAFSALEWFAAIAGLVSVIALIKFKRWGWWVQIVSSIAYAKVFADSKLFGLAALQFFFVITAIWGWWQWHRQTQTSEHAYPIQWRKHFMMVVPIWGLGTFGLAWFLQIIANSTEPWIDGFATTGSLIAQTLMAKRFTLTWPCWLIVNVVSCALFISNALWPTAVLYAIFALLALSGWQQWHTQNKHQ